MQFLKLGASLYVPSTRHDLATIANLEKYPQLRSVIFCTEDAIREEDLPKSLENLQSMLRRLEPLNVMRFIRVRNPAVLRSVLGMDDIDRLTGFVFPKVTQHNLEDYFSAFEPTDTFVAMLTLESIEVFDFNEMIGLRNRLLQASYRERILSLRIGGNDLFNLLGMRRPRIRSLYNTPLAVTIAQLVTTFRPHGFNLTAPVFEFLDQNNALIQEVRADLSQGLFGKTAIHPDQIPIIEAQYRVSSGDLHMAEEILQTTAPPVFRLQNAMCEPATHRRWATIIRERARLYGVMM